MKKILTVVLIVAGLSSAMQEAGAQKISEVAGFRAVEDILPGNMKYCMGGFRIGRHWLTEEEIRLYVGDYVFEDTYIGARNQYLAGTVLMGGGAGIVVAAAVVQNLVQKRFLDSRFADTAISICLGCYGFGSLSVMTGIPFLAIGSARLKWIAKDYNVRQAPVSLDFGACPSGIGLCLRF